MGAPVAQCLYHNGSGSIQTQDLSLFVTLTHLEISMRLLHTPMILQIKIYAKSTHRFVQSGRHVTIHDNG